MYSGDECYGDEITSGLESDQRRPRVKAFPPHNYPALGRVRCKGCGAMVDVIYTYSNAKHTIGLIDHADPTPPMIPQPKGWYNRCRAAGTTLVYHGVWCGPGPGGPGCGYLPAEVPFLALGTDYKLRSEEPK